MSANSETQDPGHPLQLISVDQTDNGSKFA